MRPSGVWVVAITASACSGASGPAPAVPAPPAPLDAPVSPPPAPRTVRLSYLAPSDCPTVDGYLSHVRARSTSLLLEERELPGAGDSVDVRLDPDLEQPGWLGQLRIEGSKPLERDVHGDRCEDVVAALALITVLRLEGSEATTTAAAAGTGAGEASGEAGQAGGAAAAASAFQRAAPSPESSARPAAPAPSPPEQAAAPEPPAPNAGEAAAEGRTEDEARGPSTDGESAAPAPLGPESAAAASASGGAAAGGAAAGGAAAGGAAAGAAAAGEPPPLEPDEPIRVPPSEPLATSTSDAGASSESSAPLRAHLAPTLALFVGYASEPADALEVALQGELRYGDTFASWASPLSLTFAYASERVDEADLRFTLLTAQLGVCPPPLGETWAWLRVCGNVRGGGVLVKVSPRTASDPDSTALRPWLAVGPSLELGVPLSERWSLRGVGELAVQLVRDRFGPELENDGDSEFVPLYETKPLSLEAGLGIGYSF